MNTQRRRTPDMTEIPDAALRKRTRFGRRPGRRIALLAFAGSVAVHAVALGMRFQAAVPESLPARTGPHGRSTVTRLIDIAAVQSPPLPDGSIRPAPTQVLQSPPSLTVATTRTDGVPGGRGGERDDARHHLVDRILPHSIDHRLFGDRTGALVPSADRLDATRTRIDGGIRTLNDSTAEAAGATRRITDWTREDAHGDRWGIAPGRIYLGTSQLKLCSGNYDPADCGFVPPPGQRELLKARLSTFSAIRSQAERADMDGAFDARTRAIRARNAARRDSIRTRP